MEIWLKHIVNGATYSQFLLFKSSKDKAGHGANDYTSALGRVKEKDYSESEVSLGFTVSSSVA